MDELQQKRQQRDHEDKRQDIEFEQQLNNTLNFEVENALADRILLNQRTSDLEPFLSVKYYLSIAASVVLSLLFYFQSQSEPLSDIALKHVYQELDHLVTPQKPVDIQSLKNSIESLGLSINSLPKNIIYAGQCIIGNKKGIHIVANTKNNPVTIFLTQEKVLAPESFKDNRFSGGIYPTSTGSMILVGESLIDINNIFQKTHSG